MTDERVDEGLPSTLYCNEQMCKFLQIQLYNILVYKKKKKVLTD